MIIISVENSSYLCGNRDTF